MGILSWFRGGDKPNASSSSSDSAAKSAANSNPNPKSQPSSQEQQQEVPGMNGAVEVSRPLPPPNVTIFEFGSVAASADKVTVAGYCPVSEELEPCRWEILPASASDAPQFRVVF
ncbi:unnamed protein product [Cuscuta campestris]|uniref:Allyl alcohol dehydrogenase-like protein n=1 Tax=Cuscuta campestris TaxID=132261 RepID=A0A484MAM1_9ASTE|nr:unnamed protein product [Cuscuta campestris]